MDKESNWFLSMLNAFGLVNPSKSHRSSCTSVLPFASTTTFGDPFLHINTQTGEDSLPGAELWLREGWQGGGTVSPQGRSLEKATVPTEVTRGPFSLGNPSLLVGHSFTVADPSPGDVCNPPYLEHATMSPGCRPLPQTSQRNFLKCCFVPCVRFPHLPLLAFQLFFSTESDRSLTAQPYTSVP